MGRVQPDDDADPAPNDDLIAGPSDPESADEPAGGFSRWRTESPIGGIGTGIARGLQAVFAPPADEIAIVASVPGEPPDADRRIRVVLDPENPAKSVAFMPTADVEPPDEDAGGGPGRN
jgi:hypothetical protein